MPTKMPTLSGLTAASPLPSGAGFARVAFSPRLRSNLCPWARDLTVFILSQDWIASWRYPPQEVTVRRAATWAPGRSHNSGLIRAATAT